MTADSQWPLQLAIWTALTGSAAVTGLLAKGASSVYDHVPDKVPFPYVVIGDAVARPFDSKTESGMDVDLKIHTWDQPDPAGGTAGFQKTKLIMAAIVAALDQQPLSLDGHVLVQLLFSTSRLHRDPDGRTRHGVQQFQALTEAA